MKLLFDDEMDAEAAGTALAAWVAGLGFRVKTMSVAGRFSLRSGYSYTVTLAGTPEMRRIVFVAAFSGSPNHRDPDERARFANLVNMRYNICKAAFDEDGSLYLEYVLCVESELTPSLWTSFVMKADEGIAWLHRQHKAEFDDMVA